MAYCRWSSDNGYCDVYVYEDVHGGWTTHVAGKRRPPGAPPDPVMVLVDSSGTPEDLVREYHRRRSVWKEWAERNPAQPIDHPEAGESFNHETPGECADNLERLRAEGFNVPQYAIDNLREEE